MIDAGPADVCEGSAVVVGNILPMIIWVFVFRYVAAFVEFESW